MPLNGLQESAPYKFCINVITVIAIVAYPIVLEWFQRVRVPGFFIIAVFHPQDLDPSAALSCDHLVDVDSVDFHSSPEVCDNVLVPIGSRSNPTVLAVWFESFNRGGCLVGDLSR